MSFLLDKTKTQRAEAPADVQGLRDVFAGNLQQQAQGLFSGQIDPLILERIVGPMRDLMTQNRSLALAQAKESAGTLTGSGFANTLGTTVNRSLAEENALIADLINQERSRMLSAILGFSTAGIGQPQLYNQPGLLSQLFKLAEGGAKIYGASQGMPSLSTSSPRSIGVPANPYGSSG